jgi:hypothetical protein
MSNQCFYMNCNYEVSLIFLAMIVVGAVLVSIPSHLRKRQCKKGNHDLVHWVSTGRYGGWHHCECNKHVRFTNRDGW